MNPPLEMPFSQHGPTRTIASLEVQPLRRALRLNSAGLSAEGAANRGFKLQAVLFAGDKTATAGLMIADLVGHSS